MAASTTWPLPDFCAQQAAQHAEGEEHAAAAEIADEVRAAPAPRPCADGAVRRERDVVDVVARRLRQRPVLAEAGHAAEDELGLIFRSSSGPSPRRSMTPAGSPRSGRWRRRELLTTARRLGLTSRAMSGGLGAARRISAPTRKAQIGRLATVDADHLGTHVGQERGRERPGPMPAISMMRIRRADHRGYLSVSLRATPHVRRISWRY
jgi:hypothetical protein